MPLPVACEAAIAIVRGDLPRLSALHFSESPARDAFWWPLELINLIRFSSNDPIFVVTSDKTSSRGKSDLNFTLRTHYLFIKLKKIYFNCILN